MNSSTPHTAYTVTGNIANVIQAVNVIHQQVTEPVDLWILHRDSDLHKQLEAEKHIRRVFVSPARDTRFSSPNHHAHAIPVYGRYDEVVHLGR